MEVRRGAGRLHGRRPRCVSSGGGADPREEDIPDVPADPVTRLGDLWCLGSHRVLCVDATDRQAVAQLLDGVVPHLMVTDPPYGVSYDPAWRNACGPSQTARTGKVLNDDRADWREAWALFPGDVAYVWHGALHAATVAGNLEASGFAIRSQIIWAKERLVLSVRCHSSLPVQPVHVRASSKRTIRSSISMIKTAVVLVSAEAQVTDLSQT